MKNKKFIIEVLKTAALCRNFEIETYQNIEKKIIRFPVYLSAGQELIPSTLAQIIKMLKIKPLIFTQHRSHSIYISFGGKIERLIDELLGRKTGCAYGMGGSASIQSKEINMFGHDGHMGTQVPIGVGACFSSKKPTIIFLGDASAEEDYVLSALGWASFKKLPILFVVEDNNLSILTEKKVRRNWNIHEVAKGFKLKGYNISDNPNEIMKYKSILFKEPVLLNIETNRLFWHSGAGKDSESIFDRYKHELKKFGNKGREIDLSSRNKIKKLWQRQLEKQ